MCLTSHSALPAWHTRNMWHGGACTNTIVSRLQGTFGVIVVYVTLCARVVLHALAAYRRVRNSEPPQPYAPAKAVDGACAGAQPTRGSLLVMLLRLHHRIRAAWC